MSVTWKLLQGPAVCMGKGLARSTWLPQYQGYKRPLLARTQEVVLVQLVYLPAWKSVQDQHLPQACINKTLTLKVAAALGLVQKANSAFQPVTPGTVR